MSKNAGRVEDSASAPEQFTINTKASRWSQQGRVYRYLKDQGRSEKRELTKKAINAFFLVHALNECGTRSREDVKEVAQRCIKQLLSQIEEIKIESGLKMEMNVTDLEKSEDDSVELEESDDEPEEEMRVEGWQPLPEEGLTDDELESFCKSI